MSNDTKKCRNCGPDSPCKTRADGARVCIACARASARKHATSNSAAIKRRQAATSAAHNAKRKATTKENKRKLIDLKGGACECCGLVDTCEQVYDFHHREPELKKFPISGATLSQPITKKVITELFKCDLLCSNCHRRTHASQI